MTLHQNVLFLQRMVIEFYNWTVPYFRLFFLPDKTARDLERKVGSDTQLGSPLFPSLRKTFIEHLPYGMEIKDIIPTLKEPWGWWRQWTSKQKIVIVLDIMLCSKKHQVL